MIFVLLKIRRGSLATFLLVNFLGDVCSGFLKGLPKLGNAEKLTDESTLSTDALAKGLDYFKERPQALTPDAILGILIVRANLQWIFGRIQLNSPTSHKLESLLKECNEILNLNRGEIYPVLSNNIWDDSAEDLKWGNFDTDKYKYSLPKFNSCESVDSYFMKGTPEDSDFCINELINSECQVSEKCWFSETNKMDHSGYKTTHRLLYFIIATKLKCEEKNPKKFFGIKSLKHNLCQRMLSEAQALFEEPHFPLTRDLFLEQIALCGLEGYEEFANHVWKENVESWQNSEGCFGHDVNFKLCRINKLQNVDSKRRTKRTDTTVDGCHTHVTAVALSSLAFFLRCDAEAVNFVGGIDP